VRAEPPVERELVLVLVLVEGARASLMARMLPLERLLQMPAHRQRK
jgi:hypothetical protein